MLEMSDGAQAAAVTGACGLLAIFLAWLLNRLNHRRPSDPAGSRNDNMEAIKTLAAGLQNCEEKHADCERQNSALERRVAVLEIKLETGVTPDA